MGKYPEAAAMLERSLRSSPYLRLKELRQLAVCRRHLGKEQAAADLERLAADQEAAEKQESSSSGDSLPEEL
jgi:hypothetical protein